MEFDVRSIAVDGARIEDLVSRFEHGDIGTNSLDDPGGIPAEDLVCAFARRDVGADFDIDRVDGNGPYFDEQIVAFRLGRR